MEVETKELGNDVEMIDFGVMIPPITPLHTNPLRVRSLTRLSETSITREQGLLILDGSETHSGRDSS